MNKNKGFTLIEILAVIVLISVIVFAAVPAVISISKKIRTNMYCTKVEQVKKAGVIYGQENTLDEACAINGASYDCQNITVYTLITNDYIEADNGVTLTDPRDNSSMNNIPITVYKKNNRYYSIANTIDCSDVSGSASAKINTKLNNVRYIKDCVNGSTVTTNNHWVELQAISDGINVASGKTVTGTSAYSASYKPYSVVTDGYVTSTNYSQASISNSLQCITVDLSQAYDLDEVAVWHYWADGRTYYNNTTYVSSNNSTWVPVIANTNAETSNGKRVDAWDSNDPLIPVFKNPNILTNSNFATTTTTTCAWDNTLNRNPVIVPTGWSYGYNSGVTSPSLGYHARFDNAPFGYNVMVFPNLNSIIGLPNRWLGISFSMAAGVIIPSTTYVVTMDIYDNAAGHIIHGGIYHLNTSTGTRTFGTASYSFSTVTGDLNKWVTKQIEITTPATLSSVDTTSFYVYGSSGTEGTAYVKNIYLVKK